MSTLTKQERSKKIGDIVEKVTQMSDEQLGNVHEYTSDEFIEPNHEAEALNAVIQLSRKYGKSKRQDTEMGKFYSLLTAVGKYDYNGIKDLPSYEMDLKLMKTALTEVRHKNENNKSRGCCDQSSK